jgi:hypothetical protein
MDGVIATGSTLVSVSPRLKHPVELWPLVPSLRSVDAIILIDSGDVPARAFGDARKLQPLVLGRLLAGGNPAVKRRVFLHGGTRPCGYKRASCSAPGRSDCLLGEVGPVSNEHVGDLRVQIPSKGSLSCEGC